MTRDRSEIRDLAASVRQRLLNLAKARGEDFQATLTRYALERLLYRLSVSPHRNDFTLKGAMLFAAWTGEPHRPTWDVDFLGRGEPDIARLRDIFAEVGQVEVDDDGLRLNKTVRGELIREEQRYGGIRLHMRARLGNARIALQVDVGFGDAVTPGPIDIEYPTLLDQPSPNLRAYPRETSSPRSSRSLSRSALRPAAPRTSTTSGAWRGTSASTARFWSRRSAPPSPAAARAPQGESNRSDLRVFQRPHQANAVARLREEVAPRRHTDPRGDHRGAGPLSVAPAERGCIECALPADLASGRPVESRLGLNEPDRSQLRLHALEREL